MQIVEYIIIFLSIFIIVMAIGFLLGIKKRTIAIIITHIFIGGVTLVITAIFSGITRINLFLAFFLGGLGAILPLIIR